MILLKQDYHFESRALYPELKGKRVVVTGGASGIGKATAKRFVLEGAKVVVFDYNEKAFDALKQEIPGLAGAVKVDVRQRRETSRLRSLRWTRSSAASTS